NNTCIMTGAYIRIIALQDDRIKTSSSPSINGIHIHSSTAHIRPGEVLGSTNDNFVRAINPITTTTYGGKQIIVITSFVDVGCFEGFTANLGLLAHILNGHTISSKFGHIKPMKTSPKEIAFTVLFIKTGVNGIMYTDFRTDK